MFYLRVGSFLAWSPALAEVDSCESDQHYKSRLIQPAQARRLSELSKTAVDLALRVSEGKSISHIVLASRHGEIVRSVQLLQMIAAREELSPTSFAQSVHNTSVGIYTVLQKTHAPTTALGSGADGFMMGLVSSAGFLRSSPQDRVLFIAADEQVPEIIAGPMTEKNVPYALAMVLELDGLGEGFQFCIEKPDARVEEKPDVQAIQFVRWLCSKEKQTRLTGVNRSWGLSR